MTDLLRFENETAARDPDFGLGRDGYDAWRGFIVAHALVTRRLDDELKRQILADGGHVDRNPLEVPPATIKDVAVLETIKEGKTVYRKE